MMEKVADSITNQMIEFGLINDMKKEHYAYALVTMIEKFITILIIMLISVYMKVIIPTMFFLIFFFSLRSRTGGYHAKNFLSCFLGTILSYIIIISAICPVLVANKVILYIALSICVLIIEIIGAVNHPNWDLSSNELRESRKVARILTKLECCCILIAIGMGIDETCIAFMSIAIILCAISLSISKIINQEVKENEETS